MANTITTSPSPTARRVIAPPDLAPTPGWSLAVSAGGWVFGSGFMATEFKGGLLDHARLSPTQPFLIEPLELQAKPILSMIGATLEAAGCDIRRDLIRVWQWIVASYPDEQAYAQNQSWPCLPSGTPYARELQLSVGDPKRASTGIGVRQLPIPEAMISVDFIAVEPQEGVAKESFAAPEGVPQPHIGYAPATRFGDWVFLAGYGATDFNGDWRSALHMGEPSLVAPEARINPYIWLGSEIEAQTEYTLAALAKIAEAAGSSLDRCVKADVALRHPSDFPGMDRIWRKYFPVGPPARTVLTGSQLVIKGLRVEISLVLLACDSKLARSTITAPDEPLAFGHAPHAVRAGDFLFTSTLLPVDETGQVPAEAMFSPSQPYFTQPALRQSELLLKRLGAICDAGGTSLDQVCKVHAFFDDLRALPCLLNAWAIAFPSAPPALSAAAVGGGWPLLTPGAHVQLDAIAYVPPKG